MLMNMHCSRREELPLHWQAYCTSALGLVARQGILMQQCISGRHSPALAGSIARQFGHAPAEEFVEGRRITTRWAW